MKLNFEGLEMQLLNIPTGIDQIVHEKKGVIYLFVVSTPKVF